MICSLLSPFNRDLKWRKGGLDREREIHPNGLTLPSLWYFSGAYKHISEIRPPRYSLHAGFSAYISPLRSCEKTVSEKNLVFYYC